MGLLSALQTAASSMGVFEQEMAVTQNNVSNASTPGYVTQTLNVNASPFQLTEGLMGGVSAGNVQSSRNIYAEEAVWSQNELLGTATQQSASLDTLQQTFDVSGTSGIPGALSGLYSAFSAWSTTPTDPTAQQQVLSAAQQVAQAFNQASTAINQQESQTDTQIGSTVSQINQLSSQIAGLNQQIQNGDRNDAGTDAQLYNDLEQLSNLTTISVQTQTDGSVTVLMGGQTPLVQGATANQLQVTYSSDPNAANPNAPPSVSITTGSGQDVTNIVNQGQLAALLQFRNVTLPSVIGDQNQQGSLNQLAQSVADRVNGLLTGGQISAGPPPVSGVPLFSYQSGSATTVAGSLSVASGMTGSQLAAIDPVSGESNGIADQLAQLATPTSASDMINGQSYTDFYGDIASDIGSQASSASTAQTSYSSALAQAQNMRSQVSGVSLNDEAAKLLQFQQAYEASAQMITIINQTMQDFFTAMQSSS